MLSKDSALNPQTLIKLPDDTTQHSLTARRCLILSWGPFCVECACSLYVCMGSLWVLWLPPGS